MKYIDKFKALFFTKDDELESSDFNVIRWAKENPYIKNKTNKTLPLLKEKTNMTHKFNVGDKVRVREDIASDRYYIGNNGDALYFAPGMEKYKGNVYTISSISCKGNYEFEDCGDWVFSDDMVKSILEFAKADLKDGMVVEIRDNKRNPRYMVLGDKIKGPNEYMELSSFEDDLTHTHWDDHCKRYDIVKVYKSYSNIINEYFDDHHLELIWERKEEEPHKEMTVAEIEEKLGYKIKVVADKE